MSREFDSRKDSQSKKSPNLISCVLRDTFFQRLFGLSKFFHSFISLKIRCLVFEIWTKMGVMKILLRNRGLVERGVHLERGDFPNCFISFPLKKHVFITIGTFCLVNIHTCCNQ